MVDLTKRYSALEETIRHAGACALEFYKNRDNLEIEAKSDAHDLVSLADRAVEDIIKQRLLDLFPEDGFLGEESGSDNLNIEGGVWVCDPIDGTANFLKGFDYWCVSIGYYYNGKIELGCVYDPNTDTLFSARAGMGATKNGQPLAIAPVVDHRSATICLGISNRVDFSVYPFAINYLHDNDMEHRRMNCGALGLVHSTDGHTEGYFEPHLNSWDMLAGILIVEEAGGKCFPEQTGPGLLKGGPILAIAPGLEEILAPLIEHPVCQQQLNLT